MQIDLPEIVAEVRTAFERIVELLRTKQAGLPAKKPMRAGPRPSDANIFYLFRRSVELEGEENEGHARFSQH